MVTKKKTVKKKTTKGKGKGATALVKIIKFAKEIKKVNPNKAWKTCIKEGSLKYRKQK